MIKLLGFVLIVSVGAGIGIRAAERLHSRYRRLTQWYDFIGEVSDKIRLGTELLNICSTERAKCLFDIKDYRVTVKAICLKKEETDLIEQFFSGLGMGDTQSGVERCVAFREIILKWVLEAEQEMKSKSRLYSLLGVFCGIFVALIFI